MKSQPGRTELQSVIEARSKDEVMIRIADPGTLPVLGKGRANHHDIDHFLQAGRKRISKRAQAQFRQD